jgi:3-isopropylmalate/(R)-2-methylmalate dehydratase small subunit
MKAFRSLTARVAVLDRSDVDTDQIVAKQALGRIDRTGFGQFLFYDWRFDADGNPRPEFELNNPAFAGARILLAGRNFGCGSSREHAPWALQDYGFEVVIAPSFGDIFRSNCTKIGLVPIELDAAEVKRLAETVNMDTGSELTVDLEARTITAPDGRRISFAFDEVTRHRLLNGLDEIGLTLAHEDEIDGFGRAHAGAVSTTALV